jgi:thioredoxin reductase (NADPH)
LIGDIAVTDEVFDVAIIGAGPAGLTAALYSGRANLSTVIFGDIFDSNLAKAGDVENYPGFDSIQGIDLVEKFSNQLKRYGTTNVPAYIRHIEPDKADGTFKLITESGDFRSRSVILSTGSKHKDLNVPGEKEFLYKGVSYCAVCDGPFYKGKKVAMIGNGDQAAKAAIYLAGLCQTVVVLSSKPDMDTPVYAEQLKTLDNIEIITNAKVLAIEGKEFVEWVRYSTPEKPDGTVRVDGVFIESEVPNSVLASDLGLELDKKGNVEVNRPDLTTKVDGVFAAGDVTGGLHQISKAVGEGACAAVSATIYVKRKFKARPK